MRKILFVIALTGWVAGCQSLTGGSGDEVRASPVRPGGDTYGTSRRPDVYGGFTQPVLPTMGARGN